MRTIQYLMFGICLSLIWALPASAHYIWIERDHTQQAKLFFGEFQEGLREVSGGRPDRIPGPRGWSIDKGGTRAELKVTRQSDHFLLESANETATVIAQESEVEVRDLSKQGLGIVKPMFYARYGTSTETAAKPVMTLDILPDAKSASTFTIYFRNELLPKTKITVYAFNGWMQELQTDANGTVKISTPWPGQYVVLVRHTEKQPGESRGKKFEVTIHGATLTVTVKNPTR